MGKSQEANAVQSRLAQLSADTPIISGGVVNGKALAAYAPQYPSVSFHQSGEVRVSVLINESGAVLTATALPTRLAVEYARAAVEAAKHWRFTPTFVDGKPMKVNGIIVFNFVAHH
jgi:protein TonB